MLIHDPRAAEAVEDEVQEGELGGDPEETAAADRATEHETPGHQRPAHDHGGPTGDVEEAGAEGR